MFLLLCIGPIWWYFQETTNVIYFSENLSLGSTIKRRITGVHGLRWRKTTEQWLSSETHTWIDSCFLMCVAKSTLSHIDKKDKTSMYNIGDLLKKSSQVGPLTVKSLPTWVVPWILPERWRIPHNAYSLWQGADVTNNECLSLSLISLSSIVLAFFVLLRGTCSKKKFVYYIWPSSVGQWN